ncbi:hypothetical protein JY651_23800 [Pyxidicoccus parkwayensis]|uniref:Uncharacterized protein n=1 Tax=Pyxidicoccus parkwayensis TaxID=2813578 RepID=A0ABX7PB76_9BACT|nr:hypothetical protein [Pyxidicoccus parkwaysis]QSQ27739.1 hypothetical protein JY651_23800 [Pyxidicoccus parkwaysis]
MKFRQVILQAALALSVSSTASAQSILVSTVDSAPAGRAPEGGFNYAEINGASSMYGNGRHEAAYFTMGNYIAQDGIGGYAIVLDPQIRYAYKTGSTWTRQTVDPDGRGPTVVYNEPGFRNVFYRRNVTMIPFNTRTAVWQAYQAIGSNTWVRVHVDGGKLNPGASMNNVSSAMHAVHYDGGAHVFYIEEGTTVLRHAWWDGYLNSWNYEILDGDGGANGRIDTNFGTRTEALMAVVDGIQLHVVYVDASNGDLRHALWTGAGWIFETIAGAQRNFSGPLSAVMFQGQLHVFAYDADSADLVHVSKVQGAWAEVVVDGDGALHGSSSNTWATTDHVAGSSVSAIVHENRLHAFYNATHPDSRPYLRHVEILNGLISYRDLELTNANQQWLWSISTYVDGQNNLGATYVRGSPTLGEGVENALHCPSTPPCAF